MRPSACLAHVNQDLPTRKRKLLWPSAIDDDSSLDSDDYCSGSPNNSVSKEHPHPDDHAQQISDTPGFKPFTMLLSSSS